MANNFSNDSLFATTETGASLGTSVDILPNLSSAITLSATVDQTFVCEFGDLTGDGFLRSGVALSDFNDPDIGFISIPFDPKILKAGTLLGAISQTLGTPGVQPLNWTAVSPYTAGNFVYYYDSQNQIVGVYLCLNNVPSGSPTPNLNPIDDPTNWQFYQEAFYLRLVPAESPLQPGFQGQNRFYHYVKCYPTFIQTYSGNYSINFWAKGGQAYYGVADGLRDAIYADTSFNASNNLGVYSAVLDVSTTAGIGGYIYASFPSTTTPRFVSGADVRIRTASFAMPISFNVQGVVTDTSFYGFINTTGTWSITTQYNYSDFVIYGTGAASRVYYVKNATPPPVGTVPTNTTYWQIIDNGTYFGDVDPIVQEWNLYLDTDFFEQELIPVPAGTTASSNADASNQINNYAYNDQIVNQKQTLFYTGDYIIHDGFPFDKDSITGGSINITAGILPTAISAIARPPVSTTFTGSLPQSDNRWIPSSLSGSFAYPANANYNWPSNNGATTRNLTVFNDANHTYVPDLLNGNPASNPSNNASLLKLATPDAEIPPLTSISSVAFKTNDLMFQSAYDPYRIDGSTANDFSTFMVLYLDYVPSAVMNSQVAGDLTNWYGIMSQARQTNVLATDIANWKSYTQIAPRLSVRYKLDGTVTLNLGDKTLTAIRTRSGINRPFQPIIVGLTINAADTSATLTVVDTEVNRSTVTYAKNWKAATPEVPNTMLYGAVPYANRLRSSKMYVLEINHYYSSHDNAFFDNEIKTMDKMYAVTSGRVS